MPYSLKVIPIGFVDDIPISRIQVKKFFRSIPVSKKNGL